MGFITDDENFFPFIERNLIKKYNQFFNEKLTEDSIKVSSNMENIKKKRVMVKKKQIAAALRLLYDGHYS